MQGVIIHKGVRVYMTRIYTCTRGLEKLEPPQQQKNKNKQANPNTAKAKQSQTKLLGVAAAKEHSICHRSEIRRRPMLLYFLKLPTLHVCYAKQQNTHVTAEQKDLPIASCRRTKGPNPIDKGAARAKYHLLRSGTLCVDLCSIDRCSAARQVCRLLASFSRTRHQETQAPKLVSSSGGKTRESKTSRLTSCTPALS